MGIRKIFKKFLHGSSAAEDSKAKPAVKKPATKSTATPKKSRPVEGKKETPDADHGIPPAVSNKPDLSAKTPEALCGIDPKKMKTEEIRLKLAELYRRHNHAAGSLNAELREEAETMLDAVVACREKYIDGKK